MENQWAAAQSWLAADDGRALGALDALGAAGLPRQWVADWFWSACRVALAGHVRERFWARVEVDEGAAVEELARQAAAWSNKAAQVARALGEPEARSEARVRALVACVAPPGDAVSRRWMHDFLASFYAACDEQRSDAAAKRATCAVLSELGLTVLWADCVDSAVRAAVDARVAALKGAWDEPVFADTLAWVRERVWPWLSEVHADPGAAREAQAVAERTFVDNFARLRVSELFDLIVGFEPDVPHAVHDLKLALDAGADMAQVTPALTRQMAARLLHPGANTADIIHTYQLAIVVLRTLDPSGVTLDRVAAPLRKYLSARPDTIRCVVQSLTDPQGELFAELSKMDAPALDAEEDPSVWQPAAADGLPQSEGASRNKDVVQLLVDIFGGSEPFVAEFKLLLGERLLALARADYNVDAEIRNCELLKLRFGEAALHECEIMLRDVADSKRITKHFHSASPDAPVSGTIVSHLFWPPARASELQMPARVAQLLERFQQGYTLLKPSRKLVWNFNHGTAVVDVTLPGLGPVQFEGVSLLQLAIVELFQKCGRWSLPELAAELHVSSHEAVRRSVAFWVGHGVLHEERAGVYAVGPGASGVGGPHQSQQHADPMMLQSDDDADDDWTMVDQFVSHMLTNLGALALQQIHDQLVNFMDEEYTHNVGELKAHLAQRVKDDELVLRDGLYTVAHRGGH